MIVQLMRPSKPVYTSRSPAALYGEVQRFRQPLLWALVLGIAGVSIWSFVQQIILDQPFGTNPAPDWAVVLIAVVFGLGLPAFFYSLRLITEVKPDGIYVRFVPFHLSPHRIAAADIVGYEAVTYSPLRDYGGWGIRFGRRGKAYNVSGDRGVSLKLSNGSELLVGSQRPEEMVQAISRLRRGM